MDPIYFGGNQIVVTYPDCSSKKGIRFTNRSTTYKFLGNSNSQRTSKEKTCYLIASEIDPRKFLERYGNFQVLADHKQTKYIGLLFTTFDKKFCWKGTFDCIVIKLRSFKKKSTWKRFLTLNVMDTHSLMVVV